MDLHCFFVINKDSINGIAYAYEQAEGVEKNEALAVEYYRKAALKDYSVACVNLGLCYEGM